MLDGTRAKLLHGFLRGSCDHIIGFYIGSTSYWAVFSCVERINIHLKVKQLFPHCFERAALTMAQWSFHDSCRFSTSCILNLVRIKSRSELFTESEHKCRLIQVCFSSDTKQEQIEVNILCFVAQGLWGAAVSARKLLNNCRVISQWTYLFGGKKKGTLYHTDLVTLCFSPPQAKWRAAFHLLTMIKCFPRHPAP